MKKINSFLLVILLCMVTISVGITGSVETPKTDQQTIDSTFSKEEESYIDDIPFDTEKIYRDWKEKNI